MLRGHVNTIKERCVFISVLVRRGLMDLIQVLPDRFSSRARRAILLLTKCRHRRFDFT